MPYKTWHLLKLNQRDVRVRFYPIMWKMMSIRHAFISPLFPRLCHRRSREKKAFSTCLNIRTFMGSEPGGDIIMKIICRHQKSGTMKAAGKELNFRQSKHNQESRGLIFLGWKLVPPWSQPCLISKQVAVMGQHIHMALLPYTPCNVFAPLRGD